MVVQSFNFSNLMKCSFKAAFLFFAALISGVACTKGEPQTPSGGGFEELVPVKPDYSNVKFFYNGTDEDGLTDIWTIVLYTDMEMTSTGSPLVGKGPGQAMRIVVNAEKNPSGKPDLSYVAGDYSAPSSSGDFSAGTWQTGFFTKVDSPWGGVDVPSGTYFADFAEGSDEFDTDLLREGGFSVSVQEDGTVALDGILVGGMFLKRYFSWTGKPEVNDVQDEISVPSWPNSNLSADVVLPSFTQARLIDRKDVYTYDQRARSFVLYLAEDGVDISGEWPAGSGKVLRMEVFVSWETAVENGLPEGTYTALPASTMYWGTALRGEYIKPGVLLSGRPDVFSYFSGTWYLDLDNGTWKDYARVDGGKLTVSRDGISHELEIDLQDCSSPAFGISGTWGTDAPISL